MITKVLDHGFVILHDSMPALKSTDVGYSKLGTGDKRVVEAARVSFAHLGSKVARTLGLNVDYDQEAKRTEDDDVKLINYLLKNAHTSPFEKVRFEFIVKLPIFIARQWIRHRMGSFNEMSARYTQLPNEFYVPELARMQAQSSSNKQASGAALPSLMAAMLNKEIEDSSRKAYETYQNLLENGLARELARMVLPTNFYTQWYWTVDLHNLMHFLKLRLHPHAQYEIRVYAEAMLEQITFLVPASVAAFKEHVLKETK